ncbi:MAG: hypothetical protein ACXWC1_30610 [Burkholderiales bacterium]
MTAQYRGAEEAICVVESFIVTKGHTLVGTWPGIAVTRMPN